MTAEILMPPCCSKSISMKSDYKSECRNNFLCRSSTSNASNFMEHSDYEQSDELLLQLPLSSSSNEAAGTSNTDKQQSQQRQQSLNNCNNNRRTRNYDTRCVTNTVAQALITRLQRWCCQLFWLTIVCVIGCCGDKNNKKTAIEVRRDILNATMRRDKEMNKLEIQLLRRLTNPSASNSLRPLRSPSFSQRKRHTRAPLSRPPSPNLFAIEEERE